MNARTAIRLAGLAAVAALSVGCGVHAQREPEPINQPTEQSTPTPSFDPDASPTPSPSPEVTTGASPSGLLRVAAAGRLSGHRQVRRLSTMRRREVQLYDDSAVPGCGRGS